MHSLSFIIFPEMSFKSLVFLAGTCFLVSQVNAANERLKELFYWKTIDFDFPDEATRNKAIESKEYIRDHNLPLGLERWHDKLFVTVPRWKNGIASTLNYINLTGEFLISKLYWCMGWGTDFFFFFFICLFLSYFKLIVH